MAWGVLTRCWYATSAALATVALVGQIALVIAT
jgi:hypothetical protein